MRTPLKEDEFAACPFCKASGYDEAYWGSGPEDAYHILQRVCWRCGRYRLLKVPNIAQDERPDVEKGP